MWYRGLVALRHVGYFGLGIEPMSPALTGWFFTTEPPGKSWVLFFFFFFTPWSFFFPRVWNHPPASQVKGKWPIVNLNPLAVLNILSSHNYDSFIMHYPCTICIFYLHQGNLSCLPPDALHSRELDHIPTLPHWHTAAWPGLFQVLYLVTVLLLL